MDGVPGIGAGMIEPGGSTVYEFDAFPFGCHLYHCHSVPLKRHIHKGLYGAFVIDPDPERYSGQAQQVARSRNHTYPENKDVHEMMMVMNAFDTNFDNENEVYAVNSIAFAYNQRPIQIRRDQRQRIYLINITEFDPINSLHIHANFFDYYDHGTTLEPTLRKRSIRSCSARPSAAWSNSPSPGSNPDTTCSTRTRASLPSWAGWASSKCSTARCTA